MRGDHVTFPLQPARGEGLLQRMGFQQQPQGGDLAQLGGGDRRDRALGRI